MVTIIQERANRLLVLVTLALAAPSGGCTDGDAADVGADLTQDDGMVDMSLTEVMEDDGMSDIPSPELTEDLGPEETQMACIPTTPDAQGPFYNAGAPFKNPIADPEEPGTRLILAGRIADIDCSGIAEAVVDVWQTDAEGLYPTAEEGFRLRGKVAADEDGHYSFETILPGFYEGRPRHIHVKVSGAGMATLTTQIYFAGDPFLWPEDSCGPPTCNSDDPGRIVELHDEVVDGNEMLTGSLDFTLDWLSD